MISPTPAADVPDSRINLETLLTSGMDGNLFQGSIRNLHKSFYSYAATSPAPFIAPGLIVTPEIRRQSELYLPIAEIARIFNRLYHYALTYPPVLSSTPFHKAVSWADVFVALPPSLQFSPNPANLLEALLSDQEMLTRFLFASFLPRRFYGGFGRYPEQVEFIREWLGATSHSRRGRGDNVLRCLDAACGTGEGSYGMANLLMEFGFAPDEIQIEGWTVEPLEVWAASHRRFPYDPQREETFQRETSRLVERGYQNRIRFRCADLTERQLNLILPDEGVSSDGLFDLIICNGLIGGPIIGNDEKMGRVVSNLATMLAPGGILLATDSFHGGWKSKCRKADMEALFLRMGLGIVDTGEGAGAVKLNFSV
ncbi:MAG: chemotaxis protein CheR [Desulfuromonadaceae bacterium]|nr:chemotaxis protein CheR [Desulfuromonadaceae bacterium]